MIKKNIYYKILYRGVGGGYGVYHHFQTISQLYILAVSFIGGGNWSTQRKPLTHRKSLTKSHNVVSSTPRMSEIRTHNVSGDRH